jgi:hypothetical protein
MKLRAVFLAITLALGLTATALNEFDPIIQFDFMRSECLAGQFNNLASYAPPPIDSIAPIDGSHLQCLPSNGLGSTNSRLVSDSDVTKLLEAMSTHKNFTVEFWIQPLNVDITEAVVFKIGSTTNSDVYSMQITESIVSNDTISFAIQIYERGLPGEGGTLSIRSVALPLLVSKGHADWTSFFINVLLVNSYPFT